MLNENRWKKLTINTLKMANNCRKVLRTMYTMGNFYTAYSTQNGYIEEYFKTSSKNSPIVPVIFKETCLKKGCCPNIPTVSTVWYVYNFVTGIISKLDSQKASRCVGVPTIILKKCALDLDPDIFNLYKYYPTASCFPACKFSSVVPLFKNSGDLSYPSIYRPINFLSLFGIVFVALINVEVVKHLISTTYFLTKAMDSVLPGWCASVQLWLCIWSTW